MHCPFSVLLAPKVKSHRLESLPCLGLNWLVFHEGPMYNKLDHFYNFWNGMSAIPLHRVMVFTEIIIP